MLIFLDMGAACAAMSALVVFFVQIYLLPIIAIIFCTNRAGRPPVRPKPGTWRPL
jgi:hypothetical protein